MKKKVTVISACLVLFDLYECQSRKTRCKKILYE